ncbi:MAG: type IV secretion protein IcmL [Gammaproteobacteria bacterium RIFCSPHIGHO2_12_FULL_41_15]|nr:MAG: type IV secretion protein IcmL [Gammaproteobacteria bacterium RIFCSPHIGHO2_12_FULL_41_15]
MRVDSEQLELEKNDLYRDHYRRVLSGLIAMVVTCLALSLLLAGMVLRTSKTNYYATTTTGQIIPMQPLSAPVVTGSYLLQWAELATRACFNLDFVHYSQQLEQASSYFTPTGWNALMGALKKSKVLDSLEQNKLMMSAVVDGPAVILDEEIVRGRYTWRVQLPLLVTYTSASENKQAHFTVTMDIVRVPVLEAAKGIQIDKFSAE